MVENFYSWIFMDFALNPFVFVFVTVYVMESVEFQSSSLLESS